MSIWAVALLTAAAVAGLSGGSVQAAEPEAPRAIDVRARYERLAPGMSWREVAALADGQLRAAAESVTTWLLWGPTPDGNGAAVLRAAF